jgi:hypothetical protein
MEAPQRKQNIPSILAIKSAFWLRKRTSSAGKRQLAFGVCLFSGWRLALAGL